MPKNYNRIGFLTCLFSPLRIVHLLTWANRIPTCYKSANVTVEVLKHLLYSRHAWDFLSS